MILTLMKFGLLSTHILDKRILSVRFYLFQYRYDTDSYWYMLAQFDAEPPIYFNPKSSCRHVWQYMDHTDQLGPIGFHLDIYMETEKNKTYTYRTQRTHRAHWSWIVTLKDHLKGFKQTNKKPNMFSWINTYPEKTNGTYFIPKGLIMTPN